MDRFTLLLLKDVFRVTVIGKLLHSAPARSGLCSAIHCTQLNSFLHRREKVGYCDRDSSSIATYHSVKDDNLCRRVLLHNEHLQKCLHEYPGMVHFLRRGTQKKLTLKLLTKNTKHSYQSFRAKTPNILIRVSEPCPTLFFNCVRVYMLGLYATFTSCICQLIFKELKTMVTMSTENWQFIRKTSV